MMSFRILLVLLLLSPRCFSQRQPSLKVVLVGDSTVADYRPEEKMKGWGQKIGEFVSSDVEVLNLALCGASTKTFFATPRWSQALASGPDIVLIQFGHNDSHASGQPESTPADGEYADNIRRYVQEARQTGANPILVTPMHRRLFDAQGNPTGELKPYALSMKRVAEELTVPVIDLYEASESVLRRTGEDQSADFYAPGDRTHFSDAGARLMAFLVLKAARDCDPRLKAVIQNGKIEAFEEQKSLR